jgi:hypothetical protein
MRLDNSILAKMSVDVIEVVLLPPSPPMFVISVWILMKDIPNQKPDSAKLSDFPHHPLRIPHFGGCALLVCH